MRARRDEREQGTIARRARDAQSAVRPRRVSPRTARSRRRGARRAGRVRVLEHGLGEVAAVSARGVREREDGGGGVSVDFVDAGSGDGVEQHGRTR